MTEPGMHDGAQRRGYRFVITVKGKTDTALRESSARHEGEIVATLEKIDMFAAKLQHALCQKHFNTAIRPIPHQLFRSRDGQCFEYFATSFVIDRLPVVRIYQTIIPNLVALINVGHPRRSQLEQRLS